jgi:hypothetical protein
VGFIKVFSRDRRIFIFLPHDLDIALKKSIGTPHIGILKIFLKRIFFIDQFQLMSLPRRRRRKLNITLTDHEQSCFSERDIVIEEKSILELHADIHMIDLNPIDPLHSFRGDAHFVQVFVFPEHCLLLNDPMASVFDQLQTPCLYFHSIGILEENLHMNLKSISAGLLGMGDVK